MVLFTLGSINYSNCLERYRTRLFFEKKMNRQSTDRPDGLYRAVGFSKQPKDDDPYAVS